jgi:hypothetical protein
VWENLLDAWRQRVRRQEGPAAGPTAAIIDSPSVQGTRPSGVRGSDAGTKVKGTKRHRLADTVGLLLCVAVPAAHIRSLLHQASLGRGGFGFGGINEPVPPPPPPPEKKDEQALVPAAPARAIAK